MVGILSSFLALNRRSGKPSPCPYLWAWGSVLLNLCPSARLGVARASKITEGSRRKNGSFGHSAAAAESRFSAGKTVIFLVPREGRSSLALTANNP